MESSEIFLAVWAIIATILAIVFKHRGDQAVRALIIFRMGVLLIAEGKAEATMNGDTVQIKSVEGV
jgi:predicted negative regulator of RcsB-dependent stress response